MIRKVYLKYLLDRLRKESFFSFFKYGYRYVFTYISFKTNRSFSGPIQGTLCLTYNCNLKCKMCDLPMRHLNYNNDPDLINLTLTEWKQIIDDFSKMSTSAIAISGGEPLLNHEVYSIIKYIKDSKMIAQMTSNGWFITPDVADKIILSQLDGISISIDAETEKVHDKIRGFKGSFKKAFEAIANLDDSRKKYKSDITISISTTFGKFNYNSMKSLIELAKTSATDRIGFIPVHNIAPLLNDDEMNMSRLETEEIFIKITELQNLAKEDNFIETSERYLQLFHDFFQGKPLPQKCMAGFTTLVVDCYGRIFPCFSFYEMEKSWGNIREFKKGLYSFWKSKEIQSKRKSINSCRDCYWNCQVETNLLYKW
ncbi:MAG: radical SAM protein [Bacteriovoracaceae bacterium]|jgi:radical SAM protein with 4Fe4S-binding SPASM domain|nr:radical SAM protein [Bacteriovoracaceae bacterium]